MAPTCRCCLLQFGQVNNRIYSTKYQCVSYEIVNCIELLNFSTTMILKSTAAISKPITGDFSQHFDTLRFALKYAIPTPDDIDLAREEDFTHPQEPLPQELLRTKVYSFADVLFNFLFTQISTQSHFRSAA